jgi:hypothetical protein
LLLPTPNQIRVWFAKSRNGVEALFAADGKALNLPYWQTIDARLQYALTNYPWVQLQVREDQVHAPSPC